MPPDEHPAPDCLELVFHGRVQGVGFRARTRDLAERHGIEGWVRNEPDGTVRCVAQANPEALRHFRTELEQTMRRHIDRTDVDDHPPVDANGRFEIRYA